MAIRTFSAQESYKGGGIEPRKKLKKVRSVKVANLDRLRLSMRRNKARFDRGVATSTDEATDPSGSSSAAISGASSPNYMKATTCSSARKGTVQVSSGILQSSSASSSDTRISSATKSASKFNKASVQECADPAGVYSPIKIKVEKSLKRVPSLKQSKKLFSKKSMKTRARYSQFPDVGISPDEMLEFLENTELSGGGMEIDSESLSVSASHDQDRIGKEGVKQKGILQRSRSRKMTRLRSIRSSRTRQRPQSRLSGGAAELMSYKAEVYNAEPHYMKGITSQGTKKISDKGLTRTSSLRPLRILAKVPSLRPKRSKVKKRPQATPLSGKGVYRATCSSTLKRTEFPDNTELHWRGQESEGTSSHHICPYSYCSIHGHRHNAPSQPLTEFISAKRKLFSNQNGEKPESQHRGEVEHCTSATGNDHSRQRVSAKSFALQEVINVATENALEAEEDGIEFLIKIYAKPRKKWATEGILSKDATASLNGSTYDQISVGDYEGKQAEAHSETSELEDTQGSLNDDLQEKHEPFSVCNVGSNDTSQQHNRNVAALSFHSESPDNSPNSVSKAFEPSIAGEELQNSSKHPFQFASRKSAVSPGGDLINILSDKQKYSSMWQLIHQQLLSSGASMNESEEVLQADEKESDGTTCQGMSNLDLEQSNLTKDVEDQVAAVQKLELHQTAAIKLVQDALNTILQHDAESYHQQPNPVQEMAYRSVREQISPPTASAEEDLREGGEIDGKEMSVGSGEKQHRMKQICNRLLQKEPDEQEMLGRQMSKSFSKLRKVFVTAKFIKAMESLKKINPCKPHYLSAGPTAENERVYLRHQSMNERRNTEEWMLDNALKHVISRLDPDQQRRVAQLVEAFETVGPEQEGKSNRHHPVTSAPPPSSNLAIPMIEEKRQSVEPEQDTSLSLGQIMQKKDDGVLVSQKCVPKEQSLREEREYQTTGDKILLESDETNTSNSTLVDSEKLSKTAYVNTAVYHDGVGIEEPINTLTVPSQFPIGDSEVSLASDMTNIFFNKQQYTGMWNLIYQHVVSSETSVDEKQGVNGYNEENCGDTNNYTQIHDRDSIPSSCSMDQLEDDDNQSAASEKPELDQSAAIKLVKEALSAILKRYEQPPHLQSIPYHQKAAEDARDLHISTPIPCTEENYTEEGKSAEKHTNIDLEDMLHHVQNSSLPIQQQVESDELKAPQRKMSKSLSKLKKAIATARFIKAMERLTRSSPRKSQNWCSDTTSEEEKVYLRHQSMDGRKKGEEWMLDYALRQVISKLDPDQQRKVALLVEAFETVHPEQKEKSIKCYPSKGEGANNIIIATSTKKVKECNLESQQKRSISTEQIPQKQDNVILLPSRNDFPENSLQEQYDQQTSLADDTTMRETNKTAISNSNLGLSANGSRLASVVVTPEEPSIRDVETGRAFKSPSPLPSGNFEVRPDGDMASILLDRQKYTSMWYLIHQHVISNKATDGKKGVIEVDEEEEQGDDANTCQAINGPDSTQSTQLKKSKVDEEKQSAALDQSAAMYLVNKAVNAILQLHEQRSDPQSLQDNGRAADNARELCDITTLPSTKQNSEGKGVEKHRNSEPEENLHELENTSAPFQQQAESIEAKKNQMKMSKSLSKLKKAIVTTKFIKAMERLRKISPRKPRHLSPELASEEERVYLRHLSIEDSKIDEEWMLDYALRKVLSNLAPDQQRKVALLVEAFETVNPKKKGFRYQMKSDCDPAIEAESKIDKKRIPEPKHGSSMSYNDGIPPIHMLGKGAALDECVQEDHCITFTNLRTELSRETLDVDDSNLYIHNQASSKGSLVSDPLSILTVRNEETNDNLVHEASQHDNDPEQDNEADKTKGIFCDKQKNTGMWHLIYQHLKSVNAEEAGSKLDERVTSEDQMNKCDTSSDILSEADADDSDASSVTSELTENDAIKLVREAINDILDAPQDLKDGVPFSNKTVASEEGQRAEVEEKPKKSLSRGYSKLRKFIICKKFIKAMENTQKINPQKQTRRSAEVKKAHLKTCAVGERKEMEEWMLDNVLQKVIAGLAPVQQRRVSLLVEAFEKVNPDPEERGKGHCFTETEFPGIISSEGDIKEKEDTVSSQKSKLPSSFDLKLDRSPTSSREVVTEKVLQGFHKDISPGLTKECASKGESWRSGDPCYSGAPTFDAIKHISYNSKDPTEIDDTYAPGVSLEDRTNFGNEEGAQLEEKTSNSEQEIEKAELSSKFAKKLPQPEDLEDEWTCSAQKSRTLEKSTGLWGLILQHVTTDMLEKNEAPETVEIDADAQGDNSSTNASERKTDDSSQISSRVKSCRDMGVQTPTSFEIEEKEAIKLVEEAVEEILLLQDRIFDTESMTSSTTSEQGVCSQNNGNDRDPSPAATDIATSLHNVATPEEEETSSKENSPNSYSTLSKVVLCKRFIKAMNKMRKPKALQVQDLTQPPHPQEKGISSLRQISTRDKASWEEGMLDNALQKVIGNLAPAKKQRVALLVQAFETVGLQPEATRSRRAKASVS